jgi:general secretion pathway protein B
MPSAPTPRSDTRPTPAVASLAAVRTRDQQIAAGANLPVTTLNLHVYDADPSKRFILLNGERLRESDASRDGLKVLSITPEGVVLSYGSSSFAVSIEGR